MQINVIKWLSIEWKLYIYVALSETDGRSYTSNVYLRRDRDVAREPRGQFPLPIPKSAQKIFRLIKPFSYKPRKTSVQINEKLKKPILLQFLVEADRNNMVY